MKKTVCVIILLSLLLALAGCGPREYDVIMRVSNLSVDADGIAVGEEDFEATLEAEELYKLPEIIEVIVDGDTLDPDDYSYDSATGELEIPGEAITGDVQIKAEAELISYDVLTDASSGISIQGEALAYPQQTYKATLVAEEYYLLPENIAVSVGGETLGEGDYTYDPATGELVIAAEITGEIQIIGEAQPVVYALDTSVTGVTISCDESQISTGAAPAFGYAATLICGDGYTLPETVEVLIDGTALEASAYTYDAATGKLVIPGAAITGDLRINVTGVPRIVGDWTATVNFSAYMNDYISASDPGLATYFEFSDLSFDLTIHFNADMTGGAVVDPESMEALFEKMKDQMVDGMKVMLQDLLAAQGLDMDVDTYLALVGMDLDDLFDQAMNIDDLGLEDLGSEGAYFVDGNKLFMINEGAELDEDDYLVYSLDGDTLIFESLSSEPQGQAAYLLPMTLTRVTE